MSISTKQEIKVNKLLIIFNKLIFGESGIIQLIRKIQSTDRYWLCWAKYIESIDSFQVQDSKENWLQNWEIERNIDYIQLENSYYQGTYYITKELNKARIVSQQGPRLGTSMWMKILKKPRSSKEGKTRLGP